MPQPGRIINRRRHVRRFVSLDEPGMHDTITEHLATALREALTGAGLPVPDDVVWEVPREEAHGDYATNVAMTLARPAKKAPRKIAEAIARSDRTSRSSIWRAGGRFPSTPASAPTAARSTSSPRPATSWRRGGRTPTSCA